MLEPHALEGAAEALALLCDDVDKQYLHGGNPGRNQVDRSDRRHLHARFHAYLMQRMLATGHSHFDAYLWHAMDKSKEKEEYLSLRGAEVAVGGNGKRGDRKLDLTSAVGRRFPPHSATKRLVYGVLDECERILRRVVAHIARG